MLRWKCWGRGDGSGGGDGGDGDCGARSHAACRGGPPWYAGEESSRAGRIFFASSALHRALGERQRFWFWAETRSETAFCARRNRPSAPNRFASRHLYQFQERSCCPPIPRRTLRCWVSGGYNTSIWLDCSKKPTSYGVISAVKKTANVRGSSQRRTNRLFRGSRTLRLICLTTTTRGAGGTSSSGSGRTRVEAFISW